MRAGIDLALQPSPAFALLVETLVPALARVGIHLELSAGGRVTERGVDVGRVVSWKPGESVVLEWHPAYASRLTARSAVWAADPLASDI